MEVNRVENCTPYSSLKVFNKNCLTGFLNLDLLNEENSMFTFSIDENKEQLATIDISIPSEKATIEIVRMRMKNKKRQEDVLKEFIKWIWKSLCNHHLTLEIFVMLDESGMDSHLLKNIGFVNFFQGSPVFTLLNPNYLDLVEAYSLDDDVKKKLIEHYNIEQTRKAAVLNYYEQICQNMQLVLDDPEIDSNSKKQSQKTLDINMGYINALRNDNKKKSSNFKKL